jgi:Holliday junction DNA helicase RuvB
MGILDWFFKPFTEVFEKEEKDRSRIIPPASSIYRPRTFEEYIGQENGKRLLTQYIKAVQDRDMVFPHTLIHGKAGMGKTTLARIIANNLGVDLKEMITSDVTDINTIVNAVNGMYEGIIFLDEIHSISRDNAEKLYTVMEDFIYNNEKILPFTLMGATTELGEILKSRRPFYDRFKIIIELENYTKEDLMKIGRQYKDHTFKEDNLDTWLYELMAVNCRGTPRFLLRLLDATIYFDGDIYEVLKSFGIIKNGYTEKDLKVLKYITTAKTVGLQGIASFLDTSTENYLYEMEPYLLQNGVITRTARGRRITEYGQTMIEELEKFKNEV